MSDSFQIRSILVIGENPNTRQFLQFHGETNDAPSGKIGITGNNGTGKSSLLSDFSDHFQGKQTNENGDIDTSKATKLIASSLSVNGEFLHRVTIHRGSDTIARKTFFDSDALQETLNNLSSSERSLKNSLDALLFEGHSEKTHAEETFNAHYFPVQLSHDKSLITELNRHFSLRKDQFLLYLAEDSTQKKTVSEAISEFRNTSPNQLEELTVFWNNALEKTAGITFNSNTATFSHIQTGTAADFASLSPPIQLFLTRTGLIFLRLSQNGEAPALILIDEPEVGLSSALVDHFIKFVFDLIDYQNTQLIVSTKNREIASIFATSPTIELELSADGTRIAKRSAAPPAAEAKEPSKVISSPSGKKMNFTRLKRAIEETDDQDELANLVDELMSLRKL